MSDRIRSITVVLSRARGRFGVHLSILLAAFFLAACSGAVDESRPAQDETTPLTSEASSREGSGTVHLVAAAGATGSSTITASLLPNEPVKEIAAREVLLAGSLQEPTLEIAGRDDPAAGTTGRIVICKLVLRKVDAGDLAAVNVEINSLSAVDIAVPNPLLVALNGLVNPGLVVDCGRGGTAVLALGVESLEQGDLQAETGQGPTAAVNTEGREGVRLNQLRILGPPGAEGFIETLVMERSSVFGRIELRNLQIKELVLDNVTVQP